MSTQVELKPESVFRIFSEINKVPRPSFKEEKMTEYLVDFAKKHNLDYRVDEVGNVAIDKPATKGFENRKKVIMQGHQDMVCEKNADVTIDFEKDPIQTYIDGEWMKAKGTTLGADCGIGDAIALAVLEDKELQHGSLEAVFTRDEETNLGGAFGMKPDFMDGDILINLDSEDEGQLFVGCAGGIGTTATFKFDTIAAPQDYFFFKMSVKGLVGGHSGDDINKKRANANKVLIRFLYEALSKYDMYICDIHGGKLHNAIPREAYAICAVPMTEKENVRIDLNAYIADVENEFHVTEKTPEITMESTDKVSTAISRHVIKKAVMALQGVFNGIFAISQDIDSLVETSTNLASIKIENHAIVIETSQRSSLKSAVNNVKNTVSAVFELAGAKVVSGDAYPGWALNPKSEILQIAKESYERIFHKEPVIRAIHAGLECGLFSEKYPNLDMISFGPTLRGVHSPDERLLIPTVDMVWRHLKDVLEHIPEKNK